jgi:phage terminase large subunit-like protein
MSSIESKIIPLPDYITRAIKSGITPKVRDWRAIANKWPNELWRLTDAEQVMYFIESYLCVPEGELASQNFKLLLFQECFCYSIFDAPSGRAKTAYLSVGRKAGKTTIASAIMLALMFMAFVRKDKSREPLLKPMSRLNSAALSRDQAGLLWTYMSKTLALSPKMQGFYRTVESSKRIVNLRQGIEYRSLAFEAGTLMGLSPAALVGDEWGQITAPSHPGIDALLSASGAHASPLRIVISTQAAENSSWLSVQMDDCTANASDDVVCHLYSADKELEIDDPQAWQQACPAIGEFRSVEDVKQQAAVAKRLATATASFENLILNRRVTLSNALLSPEVVKANNKPVNESIFRDGRPVACGIDLGSVSDLSAIVLAAQDDEEDIHLKVYCFTPLDTARDRERTDKYPISQWIKSGDLIGVPGKVTDFDWLAQWMAEELGKQDITVSTVAADRWRLAQLKAGAERFGFATEAVWNEVGTGFKDQSPRIEHMLSLFLREKIHHGFAPTFMMGCATAIGVRDSSNNIKINKGRYHGPKIDALAAAIMAIGCFMGTPGKQELTEDSLLFI